MTPKIPHGTPPTGAFDGRPATDEHAESPGASSARRPYAAPDLEVLGDIRDLTLGPTPGVGDSTPPNTQPF